MRQISKCVYTIIVACMIIIFSRCYVSAETIDEKDFSLKISWVSQTSEKLKYELYEDNAATNSVGLRVSYSSSGASQRVYQPGDLTITVKGIGNIKRNGIYQAMVGADKASAVNKQREWSYTWNRANDIYTFTNNNVLDMNSVISGYFELVWEIESRESIHNYSQDDINASLFLPDGNSIKSETLEFTNKTKTDVFSVNVENKWLYSYEGLTSDIEDPEQYIYVKYNLDILESKYSRGLQEEWYSFCVDENSSGENVILIDPQKNVSAISEGVYNISIDKTGCLLDRAIYVLYPKESYSGVLIKPSLAMKGKYFEGDDSGNLEVVELDKKVLEINIPSEFSFLDYPGTLYEYWMDTYFDKYVNDSVIEARNGDVAGSSLQKGTTEIFYLEGNIHITPNANYSIELTDDYLYALQNNGEYRILDKNQYSFEKVIIPGTGTLKNSNNISIMENKYPVYIYAYLDGANVTDDNKILIYSDTLKTENKEVKLPENTTSIQIVIKNLEESIINYSIPVYVHFEMSKTSSDEINLKNGKIINTSFIRLYDANGSIVNDDFTEENYISNDPDINLAQDDLAMYGMYLDREMDDITIYETEKCDFSSITDIGQIQFINGNGYSDLTIGARLDFPEEELPDQFSLYTILPENIRIKDVKSQNQFWDEAAAEGLGISADTIYQYLSAEIINNYKNSNRQYLAIHFNCKDVDILSKGDFKIKFPLEIGSELFRSNRGSISIRSCVLLDKDCTIYQLNKKTDTGIWLDDAALGIDIDGDNNTQEYLSGNYDYSSYMYAASAEFQITKSVRTEYDNVYKQLPDIPVIAVGDTYIYKLSVKNGYNKSKNIVISDAVEVSEASAWYGKVEKIEVDGNNLEEGDYGITCSERDVKIDFKDYVLDAGEELNIYIYMTASEDEQNKNKITENMFSIQLSMVDLITGAEKPESELISNSVQVKLSSPLRTIEVKKIDAQTNAALSGAEFVLIEKNSGKEVASAVSNSKGYAIMPDIPSDNVYELKETAAPRGYHLSEPVEIYLNKEDIKLTVSNQRKTGTIQIRKHNNLENDIKVKGARYGLFDVYGNLLQEKVTNEEGIAIFSELTWQTYEVAELDAPLGYRLNEEKYPILINSHTVDEIHTINTNDEQTPTLVEIVKKEMLIDGSKSDNPVEGCVFELLYLKNEKQISYGTYVTDIHGYIQISEPIPYGEYLLKEKRCPAGYSKSDELRFEISPEKPNITLEIFNQRKPGSIFLIKQDNLGNSVKNAVYDLYDENREVVLSSSATDEYGNIEWKDLEWGTYYLKEHSAPEGYSLNPEWKEVIIDSKHLQVTVKCLNETKKGKVELTKTDETGQLKLQNAVFDLYRTDGQLVKRDLVTDENGMVQVSDLEWGNYYFLETKAPDGYVLNDELIRFAVNMQNAGYTQQLNCVNAVDDKIISVTKTIKAEDINTAHGNVSFIFCLSGKDIQENTHTYYRMVTFNGQESVDENGNISKKITFSGIPAGIYQLEEEETSRYYLKEIKNLNNCTEENNVVAIDLIQNETASVEFVNEKYENQGLSDAVSLSNILKSQKLLTGIKADWSGELYTGAIIERSNLRITAFYDDGSSRILEDDEYVLDTEIFPDSIGNYEIGVSYTERGVTRFSTFSVEITDRKSIPKQLKISSLSGNDYHIGTSLSEDMFEVIAVYSDGSEEVLTIDYMPVLVEDTDLAATVSSPNWPENYPNNMSLEENTWSHHFAGADAIKVVFDSESKLQSSNSDYLLLCDDTDIPIAGRMGQDEMSGQTFVIYGEDVTLSMCSNASVNAKGFSAQLIPCYYSETDNMPYSISLRRVPSETGEFDLTFTMQIDGVDKEKWPSATIVLNAVDRPMKTWEIGSPTRGDVVAALYMDGTFRVSGTGDTLRFLHETAMTWYDYKTDIRSVIIEPTVKPVCMDNWFANCRELMNINQIPESVTRLKGTFKNCVSLKSVPVLPDSVLNLYQAFYGCSALLEAPEIPIGVTTLQETFAYCSSIQAPPIIPDTITNTNGLLGTFRECSKLQYAPELPSNYAGSLNYTFYSCKLITDAPVIPDGVTSMEQTFKKCIALTNVAVIPSGVVSMKETFYECISMITAPDIPASVTNLSYTFYGCAKLSQTPTINTTADLYYTFSRCINLTSAVIPEGVLSIEGAFSYDSKLVDMPVIPESVTNMSKTFYYCAILQNTQPVPAGVKNMDTTFGYCERLCGTLVINAEPEKYSNCFNMTANKSCSSGLVLTGTCSILEKLLATKSAVSVIEIA